MTCCSSGYPRALAGEEIPLEGRIAAVVDVFDTLTSNRVYRSAFPRGTAIEMMRLWQRLRERVQQRRIEWVPRSARRRSAGRLPIDAGTGDDDAFQTHANHFQGHANHFLGTPTTSKRAWWCLS